MVTHKPGEKIYNTETIVRAFENYATSRSCYEKLRKDYKLPSTKTLRNLTSKVSKIQDEKFVTGIFSSIEERQRSCIILVDEVYVKPSLQYHGGHVFGKAENNPDVLANTLLSTMVKCMNGGPKFLIKRIPVSKLTSTFLHEQVCAILDILNSSFGKVIAIIADNNRTNQAFFKLFQTVESKPWKTTNGLFLLFDYVHLIKSIRNNWITEKMKELEFDIQNERFVASWNDLIKLYRLERDELTKLSSLNEVSVFPKPIERQKVSTCLKVFCEKTIAALKSHAELNPNEVNGTVKFIEVILSFWKIVSNKDIKGDERHRDPLKKPISSSDDGNLKILLEIAAMAEKMRGKQGSRIKSLTRDTSLALEHTCNGLIELSESLLLSGQQYVLLGEFTTDYLEATFGELRQGSGGTYFITVQNALEKLRIRKTQLLMQINPEGVIDETTGHECEKCHYDLEQSHYDVLENLPDLEVHISEQVHMSLVYISGYVCRTESEEDGDSTLYYEKYGTYMRNMDRGGLKVPNDRCCQWTVFCYIMFETLKDSTCRKSLSKIFLLVSEIYDFGMTEKQVRRLCNIFFKNICLFSSHHSGKEGSLKILKLSK